MSGVVYTGCANKKTTPKEKFIISVTVTDFKKQLQLLQKRTRARYTANFVTIFAMV